MLSWFRRLAMHVYAAFDRSPARTIQRYAQVLRDLDRSLNSEAFAEIDRQAPSTLKEDVRQLRRLRYRLELEKRLEEVP